MTFPARIAYTLVTAYILTFYSEWMFWSGRPPSPTFFLEAFPTWIAYSFITFFFITAVAYFRVGSVWAIFLCGALYGWLLEGVLVQTMYDAFPIQISFTGLAWHAFISVVFGWWYLPRRLRESRAIISCLLFGLGLGLWSVGWWGEPDVAVAAPESIFLYNGFFGLLLIPAYMLWSRFKLVDFRPTRIEVISAGLLLTAYFIFITVLTQPLALPVLPPLLIIILWTLRKNRQHEPEIQNEAAPITLKQSLPLLLIPVTASLVYAGALSIGLTFPGLQVLYTITMPLGFILFGISIYKIFFRPPKMRL